MRREKVGWESLFDLLGMWFWDEKVIGVGVLL